MHFPIFHLDFFGDRFLIAFVAIVHVFINHAFAVGAMPLITAMEWWGWRKGDQAWDRFAYKVLFVCFIVTTTVGALTGVGIWFATALVNPDAIGSLIRVFFWVWFSEWTIFVTEVCLILAYTLLWKRWIGARKAAHIRLGVILSVASWLTMVFIVGILSFMMDPGFWAADRTLASAYLNPILLPQLAFRTPMAMVLAGTLVLFFTLFFTKGDEALRARVTRFASVWILVWTPPLALGSYWYRAVIPRVMADNLPVALATVAYEKMYGAILVSIALALAAGVLFSLWGTWKPARLPRWSWAVMLVLMVAMTGQFERAREFIRKPYVIGGYMYANSIRAEDYPLLMTDGLLPHSAFTVTHGVTPDNHMAAGRDLFMVACSRCHTLNGVNSIRDKLRGLYGDRSWKAGAIDRYLATIHGARPFMPPFPGNEAERKALAEYLASLQDRPDAADGAQTEGVPAGAFTGRQP